MVWINEFHYDNSGTDSGEFIEIAGAADTDLTGYSIVLYNGANGQSYDTDALTGVLTDQTGTGFGFKSLSYATNGIQNGNPDAIALVYKGAVVQFISYGGAFTATNGPAAGMTSTSIGSAVENGTDAPNTSSISLVNSGDEYADFTWTKVLGTPTPGQINAGQTLTGASTPTVTVSDASVTEGDAGTSVMTYTLTRTGGPNAFSIDYATANGTASAGEDYAAASGTVNFAAGQNTATVSVTVNGDTAAEANETVFLNLSNATGGVQIGDAQGVGVIQNDDAGTPTLTKIHDIQGTAFYSPILAADGITSFNAVSTTKVTVQAVVTGVDGSGELQGFFISEENSDWDTDFRTSEGIFVMTRNDSGVGQAMNTGDFASITVGETVTLEAYVIEYRSFDNLPRTFLTNPTIIAQSNSAVPLPTLVLDGSAGKAIPNTILSDDNPDYTDSVDGVGDTFDAENDALDFFETVEGMRVTIPDMVVADGYVAGANDTVRLKAYSEVHADAEQINARGGYTVSGDPALSPPDTAATDDGTIRGGRHLHDGDVNPDIVELDFSGAGRAGTADFDQLLTMGDKIGDVSGIVDFDYVNVKVYVTDAIDTAGVSAQPTFETVTLADDDRSLRVASFNVKNLDPGDDTKVDETSASGVGKFNDMGKAIAQNLGSPDIISIEEVQDNNGQAAGGVDASVTWERLAQAVSTATGHKYQWVDEMPVNGADGGAPGGNIRVGFLYNTERVQLGDLGADATIAERRQFVDRIGDGVRDAGDKLAFSDDQIGGVNPADYTATRKSLLGEFTFNGSKVYVTANHLPSKSGSSGDFYQADQNIDSGEPANGDWSQRNAVADDLWTMMNHIAQSDPDARIVAGGDFNEFYFYRPMEVLTGYVNVDGSARVGGERFTNLTVSELPLAERFTYDFDGRSQAIDHIVVDEELAAVASYDIVHINTGYNERTGAVNPSLSDHDPVVGQFDFRSFAESLVATAANDSVQGFGGDDTIAGAAGADTLSGGDGADSLLGGAGTDSLFGDKGDDILAGGADKDFFVFGKTSGGNDIIVDFQYGLDKLRLLDGARVTSIAFRDTDFDGVNDTVITLGGTGQGTITLLDVPTATNGGLF